MNLDNTIQNHFVGYNSQNTYRIVLLLAQAYGDMNKFGLNPPKYIKIVPNISGRYALYTKSPANYKRYWTHVPPIYPPINHHPNGNLDSKGYRLYEFAYHIALNLATNESKLNYKFINFLIAWTKAYNDESLTTDNFYNKLLECFNEQKGVRVDEDTIGTITNLIHLLEENCDINEYGEFYIDIEEKGGNLLTLINFSRSNRLFVTARFFDMVYAHNVNDTTCLSSGELEMLNLYSRIYDAVVTRPSIASNIKSPNLILLDEAEIGYHPEWQRKFVKNIVSFLNALGKGENFFQVVLTSHSPIILSDIPRSCTNYLTRGKPIPTQETFGANIFDLYRNSFFLGDGLIGEYALDKIAELEKEINETISNIENGNFNGNSREFVVNANKIIQLIGDDRIRDYLLDMLSEIDPQQAIDYYKMKIDNLKNKYNYEQD